MAIDHADFTQAIAQVTMELVKAAVRPWLWLQVKAALGLELSQQVQGPSLADQQ